MFNLGFAEMAIIAALALIVLGPKQMPELAKALGRMMREFKNATADLSGGLLEVKDELKKPLEDSINEVRKTGDAYYQQMAEQEDPSEYYRKDKAKKDNVETADPEEDEH